MPYLMVKALLLLLRWQPAYTPHSSPMLQHMQVRNAKLLGRPWSISHYSPLIYGQQRSAILLTYRRFAWGDNARLLVFTEDCWVLLSSLHVVRQQQDCQVQTWLFCLGAAAA